METVTREVFEEKPPFIVHYFRYSIIAIRAKCLRGGNICNNLISRSFINL